MIHRFRELDGWAVWLDVEDEPHTGLCIGWGSSLTQARRDAIETLRAALAELEAETQGVRGTGQAHTLVGAGATPAPAPIALGTPSPRPSPPMGVREKFVCRYCGEPGEPAFDNAHACEACWDFWERRLEGSDVVTISGGAGCSPAFSPAPSPILTGAPAPPRLHPGSGSVGLGSEPSRQSAGAAVFELTAEGPTISGRPPAPPVGCIRPAAP